MELSSELSKLIHVSGLEISSIVKAVEETLSEDLAGGVDVTSVATIPSDQTSIAQFSNRKAGVIAGLPIAIAVLEKCGITNYKILHGDGEVLQAGSVFLIAEGKTRDILLAERSALNFLGHLSGISTLTYTWVREIAGSKAQIRDTRKTTPGLRAFEKYAVRMGGGVNHRTSLSESILVKDNHVLAAGGVQNAVKLVNEKFPDLTIEVEVDSIAELNQALDAGAKFILLDNMSVADCKLAVEITSGRAKLEASGGLLLENAKAYAETGVDYLAIGALTHSAAVLDIGLDLRME